MPQQHWTKKEERQYRKIRDSAEDRGESEDRAEEIAARTVNKQRAREGKTKTASRTSTEDMSSSKRGGGMFAAAGVLAFYAGAALLLAAGIALALVWPAWLAALAIGVVLLAAAGVAALAGRSALKQAMPPIPQDTMERARQDARALQGRMHR